MFSSRATYRMNEVDAFIENSWFFFCLFISLQLLFKRRGTLFWNITKKKTWNNGKQVNLQCRTEQYTEIVAVNTSLPCVVGLEGRADGKQECRDQADSSRKRGLCKTVWERSEGLCHPGVLCFAGRKWNHTHRGAVRVHTNSLVKQRIRGALAIGRQRRENKRKRDRERPV